MSLFDTLAKDLVRNILTPNTKAKAETIAEDMRTNLETKLQEDFDAGKYSLRNRLNQTHPGWDKRGPNRPSR